MAKIINFKSGTISGSITRMSAVTASLLGTASYSNNNQSVISSSFALNASGEWTGSDFNVGTSNVQRLIGFDRGGNPVVFPTTVNNGYLSLANGTVQWVAT
jgi:hypothetical protein